MEERWAIGQPDVGQARALAGELRLSHTTALVLVARGLTQPADARRFLAPRLAELRTPDGMAGFTRAVERITSVVRSGAAIGVFGDFDVDGITTAALLTTFLRACGATVHPRLARRAAGYGFGVPDAHYFAEQGCAVVVTGDCGTSDHEAVAAAQARGVDVIVVDHHQVPDRSSSAFALINPHQPDCAFPFKGLASVGVAFYLAAALRTRLREHGHFTGPEPDPREWLDLVAVGTVADLAPLIDENRILVAAGLRALGARKRPGLALLLERTCVEGLPTAFDVGFRLGPRLNAPGRLGDAEPALALLLAQDAAEAARWMDRCDDANRERQRVQEHVLAEAIAQVESDCPTRGAILVVGARWHAGVLGIVAAKLVERYRRPAAVLGAHGGDPADQRYRGSVRAVPGFHAQRVLAECAHTLERFGGHEGAAGMTVAGDRLDELRSAWHAAAERALAASDTARDGMRLAVDAEIALDQVDERVAEELAGLGPFGSGNPEPILLTTAHTERTRVVGSDHLQLVLRAAAARREAIAFRLAERDPGEGRAVRVAFVPEIDHFRGQRRLRLRVRDLETSA
jgi:single-stranded-DNA-specific exonuclease